MKDKSVNMLDVQRAKKQKYARKLFKEKYNTKEQEQKIEFIHEVLDQIRVCEEICCPVSKELIADWINKGSIGYVMRTARAIKFA